MYKILFGTWNKTKFEYMQRVLKDIDIDLVYPNDIGISIQLEEKGDSPKENAIIKALGYQRLSQMPTFSIDSGLHIANFPNDKQPGAFVNRITKNAEELCDSELLDYYTNELDLYGGISEAYWRIALTFVIDSKNIYTTLYELATTLTSVRSKFTSPGQTLNSIQIDKKNREISF